MKSSTKSRILCGVLAAVAIALVYWFKLPPLNLRSPAFYSFLVTALIVVLLAIWAARLISLGRGAATVIQTPLGPRIKMGEEGPKWVSGAAKVMVFVVLGSIVLLLIGGLFGAEIFHADRYKQLIQREEGSFTDDIAELSMNQIPVVDRDTAMKLGSRKLGEMSDLVSQFEIEPYYTQINYGNRPVRVTPLIYGDLFKWFTNSGEGVPAYIRVDMVTQETTLVRLEQGMKYAPGEHLMRNLQRYIRFRYPTKVLGNPSFEIDEEGTPYWITPTIQYRVGIWGGEDVEGIILVNAVTGEHQYYAAADIPQWVDRVYSDSLVMQQLDWNGKYQSGFWNSYFGQRGVLRTTDGYNYIAVNDDVYLYTGMTSVTGDQSNVGFVLVNMRTKETRFYTVPGAEENSAMRSAEGQVQHLGYNSTFPLLLNVADRPTYFMSLKDSAGLVKMYAFVDVERYQLVGTGSTVEEARASYIKALQGDADVPTVSEKVTGIVTEITSAVVEGNTRYYFRLEGDSAVYMAPVQLSDRLPFLKAGDSVTLTCSGEGSSLDVLSME
ncbi:MAG: CbtA family protein [Clostridiales bacterium]|nr:CbtA family protein [Clostridiales bacterium]